MKRILIKDVKIINRNAIRHGDILIKNGRFESVGATIDKPADIEIDGAGKIAIPGIIDDQVHFREPGLRHKATIYTEAKAAVAGGVTSYMEMPNTKPPALSQDLLQDKYDIAARTSLANYSFFMGAGNDNLEEVLKTEPTQVCGIKAFMGSSTGNMLVDDPATLTALFSECPMLIATHCEDEDTVRQNEELYRHRYGAAVPMHCHPEIRNVEACLKSSSFAVDLAKRYGTRLHILHITTRDELALFTNEIPLEKKKITSEVCVHHLLFDAEDYDKYGSQIKCNPAIKAKKHRQALLPALLDNRLDIIASDHAPHTWDEKQQSYFSAPSGIPLVQHTLNVMLKFYQEGKISLEQIVEKMCHAPAICFGIADRGYLDEGFIADLALVDLEKQWTVGKDNIQYKCNWSPFEGNTFKGKVTTTIVSGHLAYHNGQFDESRKGERLRFHRK